MRPAPILALSTAALLVATGIAFAQQVTFDIHRISDQGIGDKIGTATVAESKKGGVSFNIAVTGIPKGKRGFHVHENGNCGPALKDGKMAAGVAAGEHYDPDSTKSHKGPKGEGHKGDLPALNATTKGIKQTVEAPRLKLADIAGRALVIHEGGDNYSDRPESGGGKARIACGLIPKI
jgi:Cu-Zn family superoxide dismutase